MNGKYHKVQAGDFLIDIHLRGNLIHEIEYYCFVKEKQWKEKLNFLHFLEIIIHSPTGFRCSIPSGDGPFLTLDDLKAEINERYGIPKKSQAFRRSPITCWYNTQVQLEEIKDNILYDKYREECHPMLIQQIQQKN